MNARAKSSQWRQWYKLMNARCNTLKTTHMQALPQTKLKCMNAKWYMHNATHKGNNIKTRVCRYNTKTTRSWMQTSVNATNKAQQYSNYSNGNGMDWQMKQTNINNIWNECRQWSSMINAKCTTVNEWSDIAFVTKIGSSAYLLLVETVKQIQPDAKPRFQKQSKPKFTKQEKFVSVLLKMSEINLKIKSRFKPRFPKPNQCRGNQVTRIYTQYEMVRENRKHQNHIARQSTRHYKSNGDELDVRGENHSPFVRSGRERETRVEALDFESPNCWRGTNEKTYEFEDEWTRGRANEILSFRPPFIFFLSFDFVVLGFEWKGEDGFVVLTENKGGERGFAEENMV